MALSTQDRLPRGPKTDEHLRNVLCGVLAEELGHSIFDMWFSNPKNIVLDVNSVTILGDTDFSVHRLSTKLSASISKAVRRCLGPEVKISYQRRSQAEPSDKAVESSDKAAEPATTIKTSDSQVLFPRTVDGTGHSTSNRTVRRNQGLESFWFGETNRLVEAGTRQMFQQFGQLTPFLVYGPTGCGKTHLLETITADTRRKLKLRRCVFMSAEQFTTYFVSALRGTGLPSFRRKYRALDFLAIDDIQFFIGKQATLREVHYTIDSLLRNGKQLVLASNRPPAELSQLGPELMARMSAGLVCCLEPADLATRLQIVRNYVQDRRLELSDEVLHLVASRIRGDARYLHGAIHRLEAMWEAYQQPISVQIAESALADLFHTTRQAVHLPDIEKAVCTVFGLDAKTLQSNRRSKTVSHPRMLAMWLARKYTRAAYAEIGEFFGHRAHNTVISAQQRVKTWLSRGTQIRTAQGEWQVEDAVRRVEAYLMTGS